MSTDVSSSSVGTPIDEFPFCVSVAESSSSSSAGDWIQKAVHNLQEHGVCVLVPSDDNTKNNDNDNNTQQHHHGGLFLKSAIDSLDCDATNDAALSRLKQLQQLLVVTKQQQQQQQQNAATSVTSNESRHQFRFREVVSRDPGGFRYDMPVPWKATKDDQYYYGLPMTEFQSTAISNFHNGIEKIVEPIIGALWKNTNGSNNDNDNNINNDNDINHDEDEDDQKPNVTACGFLINQPGSSDQYWHRDGTSQGLINVFCPLVDLTPELGPTEVWSNSHLTDSMPDGENKDEDKDGEYDNNKNNNNNNNNNNNKKYYSAQKWMPLLKRGQLLLMDYRTFHRGLGNSSTKENNNMTRTVAYIVYHKGAISLGDKLSYGLLPRVYPSLCSGTTEDKPRDESPFCVTIPKTTITKDWAKSAALLLRETGVCVVRCSQDEQRKVDAERTCQNVSDTIKCRLLELQRRITNRGVDPTGQEESFRFLEIACRDDSGRRYDMPISWKNQYNLGTPLLETESIAITKLHDLIDNSVRPILDQLWGENNNNNDNNNNNNNKCNALYHIAASGFYVDRSMSPSVAWHRNGCDEGSIAVVYPISKMTTECGTPIEVWPNSHTAKAASKDGSDKIDPYLKQGDMLLVDNRTLRQLLGNTSVDASRFVAYAVFQKGSPFGNIHKQHHLPGALTLEYD